MKILILWILLLMALHLSGQKAYAATGKPNLLGETKIVIRGSR